MLRSRLGECNLFFPKGFLAVIFRDYIVICPPVNPQCATARLRLTGVSGVLAQNSALKRGKDKKEKKALKNTGSGLNDARGGG